MQIEEYDVIKILNNNVILTRHGGKEKIVIKKSLGYGKKKGDIIDPNTRFEKVFILEDSETSDKFNQLTARIDGNIVGLCEEILCMVENEIKKPLDEEIHIRLIDHIAFTLYRIKQNDRITNPFVAEIETLYPVEMVLAEKAVRVLEHRIGISIPDDEIGFIALHIHSAVNKGKLSNTIKYAYIANSAVEIIEDELEIEIQRNSIDYTRFISHIRFAVERIIKGIPLKNDLLNPIKKTYKSSYKIAKKIGKVISDELYKKISDEEIGYITMHIERLKNASTGIDKQYSDDL